MDWALQDWSHCLISLSKQIRNFSHLFKSVKLTNSPPFQRSLLSLFKHSSDGVKSLFAAFVAAGIAFVMEMEATSKSRSKKAKRSFRRLLAGAQGFFFCFFFSQDVMGACTRARDDAPDRPYCLSLTLTVFDERLL